MTNDSMPRRLRRVGQLATSTGLTVRALHYYEQVGLLTPSARSDSGHRLYSDEDVERLYRIRLLRKLGLGLEAIRGALDTDAWALTGAIRSHLQTVERDLAHAQQLAQRLAALVASIDATPAPVGDDLIRLLEDMTMDNNLRHRISILVYADIPVVHEFLIRVFGFTAGEVTFDGDGQCVHGEVHAGDGMIWLHPETPTYQLASPRSLGAASATTAVMVDDVDEHHRHTVAHGAEVVYPPVDQPYGFREYSVRDCEGGLWSFMKARD